MRMAAEAIENIILYFSNIQWPATKNDENNLRNSIAQVRPNISYSESISKSSITALSKHNAPASGKIKGFLYVPDLVSSDPCVNLTKQYIPTNATRQANLPSTDFTLIAIAPWASVNCTKSFLAAAHQDPMRGFIFYKPDNSSLAPPPASSPEWDLHDGGRWKTTTNYPVFVVPGSVGARMMHQSSLYSGNLTNVPNGHLISELPGIDVRDYVRVFTHITLPSSAKVPSVWIFVLFIILMLASLLALVSASMHLVFMYHRRSFRRRIKGGEIDLEALGIRRFTVPSDVVAKMPLFIYDYHTRDTSTAMFDKMASITTTAHPEAECQDVITGAALSADETTSESTEYNVRTDSDTYSFLPSTQPSCAICIERFEPGKTTIQELSCSHIFHPECIDTFLTNHSSLCPLCKRSMLPKGYCNVKITNNLVQKERHLRKLRSRVVDHDSWPERSRQDVRFRDLGSVIKDSIFPSSHRLHESPPRPSPEEEIGFKSMEPDSPKVRNSLLGCEIPEPWTPGLSRQEIAERRVRELAAQSLALEESSSLVERQRPQWRRVIAKAFPGFP